MKGEPAGALSLPAASAHTIEEFCLGVLMRHPDYVYRLDRALKKAGLQRISPFDFQDTGHQNLLRVICESTEQDFDTPQQVVIGSLPLALHGQADAILGKTQTLPENEIRLMEELLRAVLELRRKTIHESLSHLRYLMQDAQDEGDMMVKEYQKSMMEHLTTKRRLDEAMVKTLDRTILNG